jgi:hypothetical protein
MSLGETQANQTGEIRRVLRKGQRRSDPSPSKVTGEIATTQTTSQRKLQMLQWLGATRGRGWLHIGAVCNGMAWMDVEVEC